MGGGTRVEGALICLEGCHSLGAWVMISVCKNGFITSVTECFSIYKLKTPFTKETCNLQGKTLSTKKRRGTKCSLQDKCVLCHEVGSVPSPRSLVEKAAFLGSRILLSFTQFKFWAVSFPNHNGN